MFFSSDGSANAVDTVSQYGFIFGIKLVSGREAERTGKMLTVYDFLCDRIRSAQKRIC